MTTSQDIFALLGFAGIIVLFMGFGALMMWLSTLWARSYWMSTIEGWAEEQGYELLEAEVRLFKKGPFFISGKGQSVFWVTVRDKGGELRNYWVRCGTFWLAGITSKIEARPA